MNNKKFITYEEYVKNLESKGVKHNEPNDPNIKYVLVAKRDFHCNHMKIYKGMIGGFFYEERELFKNNNSWVEKGCVIGYADIKENCLIINNSAIIAPVTVSDSYISNSKIDSSNYKKCDITIRNSNISKSTIGFVAEEEESIILSSHISNSKIDIDTKQAFYFKEFSISNSTIKINYSGNIFIYGVTVNDGNLLLESNTGEDFNISNTKLHNICVDDSHRLYMHYSYIYGESDDYFKSVRKIIGFDKNKKEYNIIETVMCSYDDISKCKTFIDMVSLQVYTTFDDSDLNYLIRTCNKKSYSIDEILYRDYTIFFEYGYYCEDCDMVKFNFTIGMNCGIFDNINSPGIQISISNSKNTNDTVYESGKAGLKMLLKDHDIDTENLIFAAKLKDIDRILLVYYNFYDHTYNIRSDKYKKIA